MVDAYHAEAEGARACGGVLTAVVETAEECAAAAVAVWAKNMSRAVNDSAAPPGCFAAGSEARLNSLPRISSPTFLA